MTPSDQFTMIFASPLPLIPVFTYPGFLRSSMSFCKFSALIFLFPVPVSSTQIERDSSGVYVSVNLMSWPGDDPYSMALLQSSSTMDWKR